MKILVRLPNWLGDAVMAVGAVQQLTHFFPAAEISVIVKKGLQDLLPFFPPTKHQFIFSKEEYSGLRGLWRFGRMIKNTAKFDLFVSFPDSFSSALIGYASGAKQRIGYRKEGRNFLLTRAYSKPKGIHRVEEYVQLIEQYSNKKGSNISVQLQHSFVKNNSVVVNINSEASSRRLTITKAVEVLTVIQQEISSPILLIGGKKEENFVAEVLHALPETNNIQSIAGSTSLTELCKVLASARLVLSTDSGPAHLANALGTQTIVLFGAGNENNTSPYNKRCVQTLRLGKLSCEPCTKNVCVQFTTPQCLELLETQAIIAAMKQKLQPL